MTHPVARRCDAAEAMYEDWCLIDDLRGGTRAMRLAGTRHLPKRPLEEISDYNARLCMATLFPAFAETVQSNVGRVFAEPMIVNDDVPSWIADEVLDNVDLQGRNLHVYVREWFSEAFEYGLSHTIVESPVATEVTTQAQQQAAGIRPYLIRIHPRDVLGWRFEGNRLVELRVRFCREQAGGEFETTKVEEVRVYTLDGVRVFEQQENGDYVEQQPIATQWKEIPLVTLYTKRTGNLTAEPPCRELAFLNAKHWRKQCSQDELIETASVPILFLSGVSDSDEIVIGAKHAVRSAVVGAKLEYIEHTGAAIKSGQESLESLEEQMRQSGAKLLQKAPTGTTKTVPQINEEAARDNSSLGSMVLDAQDTINALLDVIASWRGQDDGGTVKLQPNLDPDLDPNTTMTTVMAMHDDGIVSPQTVFEAGKKAGVLPEDADWEEEQVRVKEQAPLLPQPPPLPANDPTNLGNVA